MLRFTFTFLQGLGWHTGGIHSTFGIKNSTKFLRYQLHGKLSECLQRMPLDKRLCFSPCSLEKLSSLVGVGWRDRRATRQGQSHLGNGPGTAAPGVQHDCILVSFFQHFILKSKTHSARRKYARRWCQKASQQLSKPSLFSVVCGPTARPPQGRGQVVLEMKTLKPLPGPMESESAFQ